AFDPNTDTLYAATSDKKLVTVDRTTGARTYVGSLGSAYPLELAVDPRTGTLYGEVSVGYVESLATIDTSTGVPTIVGPLGSAVPLAIGLTFDTSAKVLRSSVLGSLL